MPVREGSQLKTISMIVTKDQYRLIRQFQEERSSPVRKVSFAEAGREILAAGIEVLFHGPNMISDTSTSEGATEASAA